MHIEHDIVVPILSVCPSFQCRYCVQTNGQVVTLFDGLIGRNSSLLDSHRRYKIPRGTLSLGVKCMGWKIWQILPYLKNGTR